MYKGKPTFLIGGSDDDNPYQWESGQLNDHLDLLVSVGGNFIRNTMSTRDDGNLLPFEKLNGRYEFSQENDAFWQKFDQFLQETARREIIVQLTLWDQHDFVASNWETHFWNPANNNIGLAASRVYDDHAFFSSVKDRNALLLPYQMKYIERMLSYSLQYDHVIYNITNEGWAGLEWEVYWAKFIRKQADQVGKSVEITSMEHSPQLSIEAVLENPSVFSYFEISQNNNSSTGYLGYEHWKHIMDWRNEIFDTIGPRPLLNEKIYGAEGQRVSYGSEELAVQRFWSNTFAGSAGVRFHRPSAGLGLGKMAQQQIRALRLFSDDFGIVDAQPAPQLIPSAPEPGAYCLVGKKGKIAIYLEKSAPLSLRLKRGSYLIQKLDIENCRWSQPKASVVKSDRLHLEFPSDGSRVILLLTSGKN